MDTEKIKDDPEGLANAIQDAVIDMSEDAAYVLWKNLRSHGYIKDYLAFHEWIKRFAPTAFEAWEVLEEQEAISGLD